MFLLCGRNPVRLRGIFIVDNVICLAHHLDELNDEIRNESVQEKLVILFKLRNEIEALANVFEAELYERHS